MTQIVLIAALDNNRAIGFDNQLPWHLPDDLKRFKTLTSGKTILMGRKTAESLGRALPNRKNVVLSRTTTAPFAGMHVVSSWSAALSACESDELMVIGGGEIYSLALPMAKRMHLTYVDTRLAQADTYFPEFDVNQWSECTSETHALDERHAYTFQFVDYERVKP
ncbi:MAG: dihydrofolate reductase [Arenimonas sp.]|nr:dihydrofolate reductase [Arenimonas sp.]